MMQDHNRHLAEMDKMRLKYSDMEVRMKERDKETARQVENIRTQAVFSVSQTNVSMAAISG